MDKLQRLMSLCKSSVHLTVNEHTAYYQSVEDKIEEIRDQQESQGYAPEDRLSEEIAQGMRITGTIIDLQFYPHTPIGSYNIYDYTLERALDRALDVLED